ncbi:MAG: hypothetical protein KatS3mg033_1996 [Thermonema sp.]|nr:MAG: hypothetical protein KatS3mg033_1996 [Thermonema sp.]
MPKGWMYILECSDGSYYTGSTTDLERRLAQHRAGEGANHTKKRLPVKLVYYEEYDRIDEAYCREKQVQGRSRKKKEALIKGNDDQLPRLSRNYTQYPPVVEPVETTGKEDPLPEPKQMLPESVEGNIPKTNNSTPAKDNNKKTEKR